MSENKEINQATPEKQEEVKAEAPVSENQDSKKKINKLWYILGGIAIVLILLAILVPPLLKHSDNDTVVEDPGTPVATTHKQGEAVFTLEIVNGNDKTTLTSDQTLSTVKDYMDAMVSEGKLKYQCQVAITAVTISEVNGTRSNANNNTYWVLKKNGAPCDVDISRATVEPGDVYTLALEEIIITPSNLTIKTLDGEEVSSTPEVTGDMPTVEETVEVSTNDETGVVEMGSDTEATEKTN